ncbi:hypothetical protein MKX01_007619 [Papaver californicum]|nr:hypothetical protein MKX01_007619 [Papaver californicum]
MMTSDVNSSYLPVIASNLDILALILWRLPVKSLFVFKSVSKRWYSLISDPIFIKGHFLEISSRSNPGLFLHNRLSGPDTPEFEFVSLNESSPRPLHFLARLNDPLGIRINQSCNGLLSCSSYRGTYADPYYICNPYTRQYRPIFCGSLGEEQGFISLCSVNLAFDVLKSPHYKVVCIWLLKKVTKSDVKFYHQIEIYSSETASWKLLGNIFPANDIFHKIGVFWNGSLHWIDPSRQGNSFYFNVDLELLMGMPKLPPSYDNDEMLFKYFGECRGHLHLIQVHASRTKFEILEMMTDYQGWNIRYAVNINELMNVYPEITQGVSIQFQHLAFSVLLVQDAKTKSSTNLKRAKGMDSLILVLQILDEVIYYDLEEMSIKKIEKLDPTTYSSRRVAFQYIETLACV